MEGKGPEPFPPFLVDMLYQINQTKWNLVRSKQEQNKSYQEVCQPVIDRCRFLLQEVRCIDSSEIVSFRKQAFLPCATRWQTAVRKVLKDIRLAKIATQRSSRPEDIVNSNIQSMDSQGQLTSCSRQSQKQNTPFSSSKVVDSGDATTVVTSGPKEYFQYSSQLNNKNSSPESRQDTNISNDIISSQQEDSSECSVKVSDECISEGEKDQLLIPNDKTEIDSVSRTKNQESITIPTETNIPLQSTMTTKNNNPSISIQKPSQKSTKRPGKSRKRLLVPDAADFRPRFSNVMAFVTGTGTLGSNKLPEVDAVRKALLKQVSYSL